MTSSSFLGRKERGCVSHQVLQENLHRYHKYFLVFLPHRLGLHNATVSWMLLSLPSTYWVHRVDPGTRWSEGRLGYSRALVLDSHLNNLATGVILGPLRAWRRVQLQIEWRWAICAVNGNDHIWSRSVTISRLLIEEMPRGWRATTATGMGFCSRERRRGAVFLNRVMFGSRTDYLWCSWWRNRMSPSMLVNIILELQQDSFVCCMSYVLILYCGQEKLFRYLKKPLHSANLSSDSGLFHI